MDVSLESDHAGVSEDHIFINGYRSAGIDDLFVIVA
jgi:hypothetical protein